MRKPVDSANLVLALLDEAYDKKTWHGPNLKQSIKGLTAKQAAWRPGAGRHNIWEVMLHAKSFCRRLRRAARAPGLRNPQASSWAVSYRSSQSMARSLLCVNAQLSCCLEFVCGGNRVSNAARLPDDKSLQIISD